MYSKHHRSKLCAPPDLAYSKTKKQRTLFLPIAKMYSDNKPKIYQMLQL